jgi:glycosyltransferase involved in cell wall biosynthesis
MTDSDGRRRIALLIGSAERGGAEGQLVRLAIELARRGLEVRVFFLVSGGPLTSVLDEACVPWTILKPSGSSRKTKTIRNLVGVIKWMWLVARWQPDIVQAWLPAAIAVGLPTSRLLTRARRIAGLRGHLPTRKANPFSWLLRAGVAHADVITVNASWLSQEAQAWGGLPDRIRLIQNAVTIPANVALPGLVPPNAVVVANFQTYKGHAVLLEALSLMDKPPLTRLIGNGSLRDDMIDLTERLELSHVVTFVDPPADVAAELNRANFAIHPSLTEGMSNAILEQIAVGLPVVATDVGAARVLIADDESGVLVPAGDSSALAAAISRMTADPVLRTRMGQAARVRAQQFSWQACADTYLELYRSLDSGRRT